MAKKRILERNQKIYQQREGKLLELSIDDIFDQMREERSEELMQACFPETVRGENND